MVSLALAMPGSGLVCRLSVAPAATVTRELSGMMFSGVGAAAPVGPVPHLAPR